MPVSNRIEQAPACEVINLTEEELSTVYTGAGWKLALFKDDTLIELFDPMDIANNQDEDLDDFAIRMLNEAIAWIKNKGLPPQEIWLVMCSCGQLCEPKRVSLNDASLVARMGRVFSQQLAEL